MICIDITDREIRTIKRMARRNASTHIKEQKP